MATIIYQPNYSIDIINNNYANKGSSTSNATFIANNFSIDNSTIANTVIPTSKPVPVDMNLVAQIMVDYGDGPISIGINECLVIINQNVQNEQFSVGNIFGDYVLSGGNTDFRYVTDTLGTEIVLANLQMTTLLPLAPITYQDNFNNTVLNMVRDLRKGLYDPNNYLANIQYQSRQIARIINQTYG